MNASLNDLLMQDNFIDRHIGPSPEETQAMLDAIGAKSLDDLIQQTMPEAILLQDDLALPKAISETEALQQLKQIAQKNQIAKSYIGMGYHDVIMPGVIQRNVLEDPSWYTAYTPYQPEIAQGRLEALLNFQQMIIDLTGMELANASLLDEATAAAEAMAMCKRVVRKNKSTAFFVDENALPQTIDVLKTRAEFFQFELIIGDIKDAANHDIFGALIQYPNVKGEVLEIANIIAAVQAKSALVTVATDIMSLMLLKSPGELGADIVVGNSQRFGVPMGFGGPHAAFFATKEVYKRATPGRIIGVSIDSHGKPALRMAMQTREQHIRREKANSNICTAQVLLANLAVFYAIYHGPKGLTTIANRIHRFSQILANGIDASEQYQRVTQSYFDTVTIDCGDHYQALLEAAEQQGINLRIDGNNQVGVSISETTSLSDLQQLLALFSINSTVEQLDSNQSPIAETLQRQDSVLTHPVFNSYHSETEMLRYLKRLQNKDLALNHSMISLGSCTMKLNATSEMIPVTWPEFANIHPFAPKAQTVGYLEMIGELEQQLKIITGFDAICMQPNSGAQGEYAGLLAIIKYQQSVGEGHRNICLIPRSAHGTNPASAQMAGLKVVVVNCDENGNVDIDDLKAKAEELADNLSCLMLTYPSTHGVYEESVKTICDITHQYGGQVYMDGANLNAQLGLTTPASMGADVSHMNLHKTFAIPHGGGGPGMGPIGVKAHLAAFVANSETYPIDNESKGNGAVSATPYGSASILPISYMYITMMGQQGLKKATQMALLNANYLANKLGEHYPLLYTGRNDRVAHECIIDLRPIKAETGITEVDIAKRLMDYGFHAPTMSFPVAGTFMIEPTESESKAELDRFIEAMVAIKQEINAIANGQSDENDNPLKHAPHTLFDVCESEWHHSYDRQQAAYPLSWLRNHKFWPSVNRIDDVYGDRNLVCSCPDISNYES